MYAVSETRIFEESAFKFVPIARLAILRYNFLLVISKEGFQSSYFSSLSPLHYHLL